MDPEKNQPPIGQTEVPGSLLVPNVYDLLVSPIDDDVVLAATGRDPRRPSLNGVYRSENGGLSWELVTVPASRSHDGAGCGKLGSSS